MPYIGKPEKEFGDVDLFFGALFIKNAVEQMEKLLTPLFPVSTSIQEMIDKTNSKPTIRYMTPEEVMRYLISTHNDR
jgi:hypothetical protein